MARVCRPAGVAAILVFLRATYLCIEYLVCRNFNEYDAVSPQVEADGILGALGRWDSQWYGTIASDGYVNRHQCAFFPLLPMLGRIVVQVSANHISFVSALILVSISALFIALWLILRNYNSFFFDGIVNRPVWLAWGIAFAPSSYFLFSGYTESLTLLLTTCTFCGSIQSQRIKMCAAGLAAVVSPIGIATLGAFLLQLFRRWQVKEASTSQLITVAFTATLPIASWLIFLAIKFGDPTVWASAQEGWSRKFTFPFQPLIQLQNQLSGPAWEVFRNVVNIGALVMLFYFLLRMIRQHCSLPKIAYPLLFIALSTSTMVHADGVAYAEATYRHSFCNLWFQESIWVYLSKYRRVLSCAIIVAMTATDCTLLLGYPLT